MREKSNEERLHDKVERLEELKQSFAQLQGERKQILQQLSALGAKNAEQGMKLLKEAKEEIEDLEKELSRLLQNLETEYNWE